MGLFGLGKRKEKFEAGLTELALNSISDGVLILDKKGTIRLINPAAMEILGVEGAEYVMGVNFAGVVKLEDKNSQTLTESSGLWQAIKSMQSFESNEYIAITAKSNKRIAVKTILKPTADSNHLIMILRDIEAELKEENAQMEFISTASHEMRTPVASIEGYLGLAINPATATIDERAKKYLTAAHEASQHLGQLFQDLLDVTKLDDKKAPMRLRPVELSDLVTKISEGHAPSMTKKNLHFKIGDLLSFGGKLTQLIYVMADVDYVREILGNLIENAVKYTPENGSISVKVRGEADKAIISVTDTGIGIANEDLEKVFQKFYRVDNSDTRTIGGTGLGLYLVKQRAEALGGRAWVESQLGKGSTFLVMIPRISNMEYQKQLIAWQNARQAEQVKLQMQKAVEKA